MSALALSAKLDRSDANTSWGFRMFGGKDFGAPLTIQRVTPGSLAQKCGLQEGDVIMKIADAPTDYMRHKEAQHMIVNAGNNLELALQRGSHGGGSRGPPAGGYHTVQAPGYSPSPAAPAAPSNANLRSQSDYIFAARLTPNRQVARAPSPSPQGRRSREPSPRRVAGGTVSLNVQQNPAPSISVSDEGLPSWAFAPKTDYQPPSPGLVPVMPREQRAQSPSFYDLERQMTNEQPPAPTAKPQQHMRLRSQHILASRLTPDRARTPSPSLRGRISYNDPSPAFNALHAEMAREPSPMRLISRLTPTRQMSRTPSPSLLGRGASPAFRREPSPRKVTGGSVSLSVKNIQTLKYDPQPPWKSSSKSTYKPVPRCLSPALPREQRAQSPSFYDLQRQLEHRSPLPKPSNQANGWSNIAGHMSSPAHMNGPPSSPRNQQRQPPMQDYNRAPQPFSPGSSVPVAVNKQYNTPINMYSMDNVMDSLITQTSALNVGPGPGKPGGSDPIPPWQSAGGGPSVGGGGGGGAPASNVLSPKAQPPRAAQAPGTWQPKIPTGPRVMKFGASGTAKSMPAIGGGGRIPMCNSCGTAIRGPFVAALDKTWCPQCFICSNPQCAVPLLGIGFVEEDGQLFCERDYEQFFAPRCGKCGSAIVRECVNALKDTFCPGCFTCVTCNQVVGQGAFHLEDGQIYCEKDWQAMFQTKCYGCQFPIEPGDRWVEALSQNWHSECFNCSTCQVNLEGQSFFAKGGKPYCKKHASTKRF